MIMNELYPMYELEYSNLTSGYTPKRIEGMVLERYLYTNIYSNIICNSQKVKTTQVPINIYIYYSVSKGRKS